jgi:predicted lysophospholipase L1 biosynthesis ABC-type transport system permease subunit
MRDLPPQVPFELSPLADIVEPQLRPWTLSIELFTWAGLLVLPIAGIGLYATLAYSVAAKRHDVAVAMALGAGAVDILLVFGKGTLRSTFFGLCVGEVLTYIIARAQSADLVGVGTVDLITVLIAFATLSVTLVAAATGPLRTALRLNVNAILQSP